MSQLVTEKARQISPVSQRVTEKARKLSPRFQRVTEKDRKIWLLSQLVTELYFEIDVIFKIDSRTVDQDNVTYKYFHKI